MNVYVRALASALARAGVECDVFTRAEHPEQPAGRRGRARLPGRAPRRRSARARCRSTPSPTSSTPFVDATLDAARTTRHRLRRAPRQLLDLGRGRAPAQARARPPARRDVPHARPGEGRSRASTTSPSRGHGSSTRSSPAPTSCSPSTADEREQLVALYGAEPERIEIVPPGVDHSVFSPGDQRRRPPPRSRLDAHRRRCCSSGGSSRSRASTSRSRCLAELDDPRRDPARGRRPERARRARPSSRALHALVDELGLGATRALRPAAAPRPPRDLYRAADVCIVPSRTESFGLVALEAAACGTPVVAADVGGLRSLVDDGRTGFLVDGRDPPTSRRRSTLLLADPARAAMSERARRRVGRLHVEHHRGAPAPPLRRPRRARRSCSAAERRGSNRVEHRRRAHDARRGAPRGPVAREP